jgi:hypothetical protein
VRYAQDAVDLDRRLQREAWLAQDATAVRASRMRRAEAVARSSPANIVTAYAVHRARPREYTDSEVVPARGQFREVPRLCGEPCCRNRTWTPQIVFGAGPAGGIQAF